MAIPTKDPKTYRGQFILNSLGILAKQLLAQGVNPYQIPSSEILMAWILQMLGDGSEHSLREIERFLTTECDFTEEQVEKLFPDSVRSLWIQRVTQSLDQLVSYGLAKKMGSDFHKITQLGLIVDLAEPTAIDLKYLRRFPEFLQWEYQKQYGVFPGPGAPPPPIMPPAPAPIMGRQIRLAEEVSLPDENLLADPKTVVVWFGTNRPPNDPSNAGMGFSNKRGNISHFGRCIVNIPKGHKTAAEKLSAFAAWNAGTPGIIVKKIEGMPESDFWTQMVKTLETSVNGDSMLFFVHGYRVSFLNAAVRTAQLKYDLKIPHAAFYSWPSKAGFLGYGSDVASVEGAVSHMASFLSHLGKLTADREIKLHVIAHSMGNLGLLLTLERILLDLRGTIPNFGLADVVFAAPDVDAEKFVDYVTRTTSPFKERTLYASHKDFPLGLSGWFRSATRAGKIPPVTIVKGTDTIDVSEIDLSSLGHGYVAETRPVLTDIAAMHSGQPPDKRVGVIASDDGTYWTLT